MDTTDNSHAQPDTPHVTLSNSRCWSTLQPLRSSLLAPNPVGFAFLFFFHIFQLLQRPEGSPVVASAKEALRWMIR